MCCTRLAANTGPTKSPKIRHLGTTAQICRAISSQLRHVSTIGKTHHSKFQRVSRFGFVTAATSLNGSQPNFVRYLAVSWAGTLYIHFRTSCPVTEFCQVQRSLYVQVLHSPILAALRTLVVGVSQTLRRWTEGATYIAHRGHHLGHWRTF